MTERITREQVLKAFDLTEDDMAALKALEDSNGYTESKAQYDREYARFRERLVALAGPYLVTCGCGARFNPLAPMALYGNEFHVDGVQCCPECTRDLLAR